MRKTIVGAALLFGMIAGGQDDDAPPPKLLTKEKSAGSNAASKPVDSPNISIDILLGRNGRQLHQRRLAETRINGKAFDWAAYSAWGKELFLNGQVASPPVGPSPSKPISDYYQCTHCHNNVREDRVLSVQDPIDRFAFILEQPRNDPPIRMHPGTTLWGAVNRESFYNGSYQVYHGLLVGLRRMNPLSLEDATQVCCTYCSVGRLAETWEILSLLTYFWDLELKLADLDMPTNVAKELVAILNAPPASRDPVAVAKSRKLLMQLYLRSAGAQFTAPPKDLTSDKHGPYPDKARFRGDARIGKQLYELACHHCHGEGKPNEFAGADLVRNLRQFHTILAHGTDAKDSAYMPMFPRERLSRQQIADIQEYLKSL